MKLTKHVDFDSLLSGVASVETIAQALDDGLRAKLDNIRTTMDKTASDNTKDDAVDAMAAGAVAGGAVAYHNKLRIEKAIRKLKKYDDGKLMNRVGGAIKEKSSKVKKTVKKIGDAITLRDRKREKLVRSVATRGQSASKAGKIGLGLVAGAAGLKIYNDYKANKAPHEKVASTESIRAQLANDVERESTPEGSAAHRGAQGASIGGLAGFMHGITKKSKIRGGKAKLIRGAWHGTAGAVWGGAATGGAAYAKKKVSPDTEEDKQRAYEKKLEKRAFDNIGRIGSINIVGAMQGDKEANVGMPMDFSTETGTKSLRNAGTTFNPGAKGAISIGGSAGSKSKGAIPFSRSAANRARKARTLNRADAVSKRGGLLDGQNAKDALSRGRAKHAVVKERAFIKGNGKGGVFGGLRAMTSALTSSSSTVGKFLRRKI